MRLLQTLILAGSAIVAIVTLDGPARADRGNRPSEPAGTYMTTIVKHKLANEYGRAWESLYPLHQRVAALEAYVGCESLVSPAGELLDIEVLRVFDERIRVAGETRKLKTRAVRVRVAVASPVFTLFPVTIVQTFHAIAVDRQWKWILSRYQYAYYVAGTCPY